MIVDRVGRQFKNLRISLTAACNYACTYCVPSGERRHSAKHALTEDQLLKAVKLICAATNVDRLRITGGEPLISPVFDSFIYRISDQADFTDISLTTNGQLLAEKCHHLEAAGIKRINVSLDTLEHANFRAISKGGDLHSVLNGIQEAISRGIIVKVNMVPLRRKNLSQILPLLDYCLDRKIELRYIELMRMGHLSNAALFDLDYVPMSVILAEISRKYEFVRVDSPFDSTAIRFSIPERNGSFGIIANETEPFCSGCTRLRLSSSGYLHGCLSSNNKHFIADILDMHEHEAISILKGRLSSALSDKQNIFSGGETVMRLIGG